MPHHSLPSLCRIRFHSRRNNGTFITACRNYRRVLSVNAWCNFVTDSRVPLDRRLCRSRHDAKNEIHLTVLGTRSALQVVRKNGCTSRRYATFWTTKTSFTRERGISPQKFGVGTLRIVPQILSCFEISGTKLLALKCSKKLTNLHNLILPLLSKSTSVTSTKAPLQTESSTFLSGEARTKNTYQNSPKHAISSEKLFFLGTGPPLSKFLPQ